MRRDAKSRPLPASRRAPIALLAAAASVGLVLSACSSSGSTAASSSPPASSPSTSAARPSTPAASSQSATASDTTEPVNPIAEKVDIGGGRSIYVECQGEGSPTVLLLSGGGTASDLWHAPGQVPNVYDTIGTQTRVCAWDRPGVQYLDGTPSRSTAVPQPITPQDAADDLTAILDKLDMHGPYVLVAHSFAGNIARVFAAENAADVKGMVFVDVLSPELRAQMTPEQWATWVATNNRSPALIAAYPDLEQYDFNVSLDQVDAAEKLGPMPVVVLTASVKFADIVPEYIDEGLVPADTPRDFGSVIDRTNSAAQAVIAGYFPGSEHITDTNSGHNIMVENAAVVIKATEDVIAAVDAGRTTVTG